MNDSEPTAVEGADETPSVKTNVSSSQRIAERTQAMLERNAPPPEQETEESQVEEASEEPKEQDVLSQIDLDSLSEVEFNQLKEKLQSRAVDRFGELTAKRKEAEERATQLQAEIEKLNQANPLERKDEVVDNPFSDIDSIDGLQDKYSEATQTIQWAEEILDDSAHYSSDDVVTTIEDRDFTKGQVRELLKQARKSRDVYLPDRLQGIQKTAEAESVRTTLNERMSSDFSWFNDADSDIKQKYEAELNGPLYKALVDAAPPEAAAYLPFVMAHAANSLYGAKQETKRDVDVDPSKIKVEPPKQRVSGTAVPTNDKSKQSKIISELAERFKKTGNPQDRINLRIAQMNQ